MITCDPKLEIYKFFYDFFRYYDQCGTSCVAKWTEIDVKNVLKWSTHCDEIINLKMKKKTFYKEFIQKLFYLYSNNNPKNEITFHKLLNNPNLLMKSRLIFNSNLKIDSKFMIIDQHLLNSQMSEFNENEIDKLCFKIINETEITFNFIQQSIIEYSLIKNSINNFNFIITLFDKLKILNYNIYFKYILQLFNEK
jgi:hypothetical protein